MSKATKTSKTTKSKRAIDTNKNDTQDRKEFKKAFELWLFDFKTLILLFVIVSLTGYSVVLNSNISKLEGKIHIKKDKNG